MAESTTKTKTTRTTTRKTSSKKAAEETVVKEAVAEPEVEQPVDAPVEAPAPAVEPEMQATVDSFTPAAEAAPINMYVEQKAPPVKIIYIDSVIPNNEIPIGNGRKITGSGRIFSVPMEHFEGEFMTPLTMNLIDERKFIVLSGLTEEQRYQYNCHYDEGEVVKDEGTFDMLFELPTPQALAVFATLCPEHQQLVATRFMTAYFDKHDNRITRDKVEALHKESKKHDPEGLFKPIVEDFNQKNT